MIRGRVVSGRVAAIINPATRKVATRVIDALEAACPPGVELDIYRTTQPGQAISLARLAAERAGIVVAVGGDGTVAEVATGLIGSGASLGIVPAGSTNITAQDHGIPDRTEDAARLIFGPHFVRRIDVGECGGRRFLHMAGAGLDSHFFLRTSRALKRRVGWLAYVPAAANALRQPPARFDISVDGRSLTITSPLVLVANGASVITPMIRLHPGVHDQDGWLDLLAFTATTPRPIAQSLWGFATGSLATSPYLIHLRGQRISLVSDPVLPVQLDGDVVKRTPASFTVVPRAIGVIVPTS
jgi:diacylglycerol kinase family enzyme